MRNRGRGKGRGKLAKIRGEQVIKGVNGWMKQKSNKKSTNRKKEKRKTMKRRTTWGKGNSMRRRFTDEAFGVYWPNAWCAHTMPAA